MNRAVLAGPLFLLSLAALCGQEKYALSVDVNTADGLGQRVWNSTIEREVTADRGETFLFEADNGVLAVTLSFHPLDGDSLLLVAGSDFRVNEGSEGPLLSANLKSISMQKGETVVYYPLGKKDEETEGGMIFYLEITVNPLIKENI